jgi:hypothetical protein
MLENCTDLPNCENILADASKNVRLLGDIPFSDGDLDILGNLIRQKIKPNLSKGSYYLRKEAPTCFACFLVGMGRFYDKESGYWPAVEKKVGLSGLKLQEKCGQAFLEFLEKNNLPKFDEEKGLLYVTPILNHAGIPYCCLDEFFERVLVPFVRKDLLNPYDHSEIIHDLNVRRKMNGKSLELEQERKRQNDRLGMLQEESRRLGNKIREYETISSQMVDEEECKRKLLALQGLENSEANRANLVERIGGVKGKIQELESEGKRLWGEITGFKQRYKYILENRSQIEQNLIDYLRLGQDLYQAQSTEKSFFDAVTAQWIKLSADPWDDKLGGLISELSLEQLLSCITLYQNIQERLQAVRVQIENLRVSQEERKPSLPFVTVLLSFFRKTIFWLRRKKELQQPSELQQLESTYRETEAEMGCQLEKIKGILVNVPLQDRLLDNPSADLYEELCSLKIARDYFIEAREKRNKLEEDLDHLAKKQVRGLFPADMAVDDDINALVKLLKGEIEEADCAQSTALRYEKNLELEIRPILEKARIELRSLNTNIEKIDTQLTQLGDGSSQRGLDIVREFHQHQARIMKTRQELSSRYSGFEVIEGELLKQGWEVIRLDLEKTALELEQQKLLIKSELQPIRHGYEASSIQYFGIDEPIRRFLLYGGSSAEEFLVDSVALFARVKSGEKAEEIDGLRLPNRVVQSFQKWWELRLPLEELRIGLEEEVDPETGQRFRAPQLFFDLTTTEILVKVSPQRYLRRKRETALTLEVYSSDSPIPITTSQLKLYGTSEALAEARLQVAFALSVPSEKYIFNLRTKDDLICHWEIEGLTDEKPYLAFLADSHKFIKDKSLPRNTLIIVTNRELKIHPPECILMEGGSLYGGWKDYLWYEIDAASNENLYLTTDKGSPLPISFHSDAGSTPRLIGGVQSEAITSDERLVFTVAPKFVHIPANNKEDLHLWRVSLLTWMENRLLAAKHYQASELTSIIEDHTGEGWFDIPLNADQLLGQETLGCYTLRIYKPPYLDWQVSFCIIPQLDISFEQEIYLPYREPIPDVRATLILPDSTVFVPDKPAEITNRDGNSWSVHAPASENVITGKFHYPFVDGQENKFPIAVTVPKIHWRFQGSSDPQYDLWSDKVKDELWLGDWMGAQELYLIAEMPLLFAGRVSLAWEGSPVTVEAGKICDQKVRFDLKALIDILRAGPSLGTITLSLAGAQTNFSSIPLFTVRTRWQTENIKCFRYPEGEFIRLNVTWDERGRADKKVIRLWYFLHEQSHIVQEQRVDQDVCEVEFKINSKDLKAGNYLIHIEPDDPWLPQPVHLPDNIQNAILIEIIHEAPKETVILRNIWVDAYHTYYLREGTYKIHVKGKVFNRKLPENANYEDIGHILVTPHNEGWFSGDLEVVEAPEVNKHLHDTNPVKFDYDPIRNIITSIEDRHGDGAVYCYQCGMLFWCQETALNEKGKGHRNYGPIEQFGVVWESE